MRNKLRGGFAIGTILLAVILIAAIVSAIAIASRGSSNQSTREQSRIYASALLQQSSDIKTQLERLTSQGQNRKNIILNPGGGSSYLPFLATYCTADDAGNMCFFSETGVSLQLQANMFEDDPWNVYGDKWMMHDIVTIPGFAQHEDKLSIIAVVGLKREVCQHLNNMMNGTSINADPLPTSNLARDLQWQGTRRIDISAADAPLLNYMAGQGLCIRKEPPGTEFVGINAYSFYYVVAHD